MLKKLLLLWVILVGIQAACSPGCSKCIQKDSEDMCQICDLSRFYYLQEDGTCSMNALVNCKIPSPSSTSKMCVQCHDDHFFDELAQECVAVPESKKNVNCAVYSLVADCLRCKKGYIVQTGSCVVPTNVINNCEWQISEEHCETCDSGYQLSVARTTCLSFNTINNCHSHQEFQCSRCKSNFSLAINWHLLSNISLTNIQESLTGELDMAIALDGAKEDCVAKDIANCVEYDSYGRCGLCDTKYYVDRVTGKCVLSPEPQIFKCKKYSDVSTCAECEFGFYLTGNKCVERKIIDKCLKYTVNADGCDECSDGYYSAVSSCALRNTSANIDYCKRYEPKQDKCAECEPNFILSTDFIKCFEPIQYCKVHEDASSSGTLFCTTCDDAATPSNNSDTPPKTVACLMRNNPGCIGWSANNSNECTTCLTGFYWLKDSDKLCQPYTRKCKTYDTANDSCASCFADQYLHETSATDKECKKYTVRNCNNFMPGEDKCTDCNGGYYKDPTSFECHAYTLINCGTPSPTSNVCTSCSPGFYKADDVSCLPEDLWECATPSGTNTCTTCNQGYYLDNGKCYPSTQTGCVLSSYVTNKDECTTCVSGFYNKENKFCKPYTVSNCMGTTNGGFSEDTDACTDCLPKFYLNSNNNCQPIQIPHCNKADTTGATCTECALGYFKDSTACSLQYIPFCKEYTPEKNECAKCHLGYNLASVTSCAKVEIPYCKTYTENANTCDTCEDGFEPDAAKTTCKKLDVIGCVTYTNGECTSFNTTLFWNDSGTIKPKAVAFCQTPKTSGDGCLTCVDGYKKVNVGGVDQCQSPSVLGCAVYDASGNCVSCLDGHYSTGSGTVTCTAFANLVGCLVFSRTSSACDVCESGLYWDGAACSNVTAGNLKTLNCSGYQGTTNSSGAVCNRCPSGSTSLTIGSDAFIKIPESGVLSYKADGTINQLAENYFMASSIPEYSKTEDPCLQLKPFTVPVANRALSVAGMCFKCRNVRTHYNNNGTCTTRTILNCEIFVENADSCVSCKAGLANGGTAPANCTNTTPNGVNNCKFTSGTAAGCYECNSGFLVNSNNSNACLANANNLKYCRVFSDADTTVCTECEKGAYLNKDTNKCMQPTTCMLANGSGALGDYCKFCASGFKPHSTSKYECVPAFADDVCALYENLDIAAHESICVKCKDPTMIPYNLKNGANYDFRCVPNRYGEMRYTYIIQDGATINYKTITAPNYTFSVITTITLESISNPTKICQPLVVENCKTYDFAANKFAPCTKCMDGYYLEPNGKNGQECLRGGLGGCLDYTARDNCASCQNHWILKTASTKGYCEKIEPIPNCEIHFPTEAKCMICAPGYLLRNEQCHLQDHTNCKYYDFDLGNCFGCDTDYFLKDGACHPYTNTNCLEFSRTSDTCNHCAENYYLKNGNCLSNTSRNCSIKSSLDNHCIACNDGFFLELATGLCQPNITPNCLIPDLESPTCLVCSEGFFLFNGNCAVYSVQNCSIMDSEQDKCLLCHEGFFLNGWGSCEKYSIKNCQVKDPNANLCKQCKLGFYNDPTGLCTKYSVKNCNVFNNYKDECLSCLPGYFKDPQNNCEKYTNIQNCETPDASQDACMSCKPGYYIDFGICRQYSVSNCALYKTDADICTTCKDGYFLLVYTCVPYTVRCEQYELTSNQCITCKEGYYLDKGICYVNNGLFCKELSPFRNGCESCVDGFYLDNGQCKIREHSTNCKEVFVTADLCKTCYDTHYIAAGKCISYARDTCKTFNTQKDLCVECETGKYWMSHNVCEKYTIDNCKTFDPNADKCTVCEEGKWYLDSSNGVCKDSTEVEHCKLYSNTVNACVECDDHYYLVSGSECRRNPSGMFKCIQYKDENTCVKCELGFYLDKNYCQKSMVTIANCANYSGDGVCESCDANYLAIGETCTEKVETSCATWVDTENCLTCPANKVLKTNEDSKKVCEDSGLDGCVLAKAGTTANTCEECGDKKLLVGGLCTDPVSPLVGCKVYIKEGECAECDDGYTLTKSKNGCVSNYTLMAGNCAFGMEKSSPVCHGCMPGYHLDANRECVQCGGEGCNVCDPYDSTTCIFCMAGYDHNGSSCTKTAATNRLTTEAISDMIYDHYKSGFRLQGFFFIFANFLLMILVA